MKRNQFSTGLITSLITHTVLMLVVVFLKAPEKKNIETVSLEVFQPENKQQLKKSQKVNHELNAKKIVEQDPNRKTEEVPDKAKYLSAQNLKVMKETAAQNHGQFQNIHTAAKATPPPAMNKNQNQQNESIKNKISQSPQQPQKAQLPSDIFAGYSAKEAIARQQNRLQDISEQQQNSQQNATDVSRTNDYLKDIDPGIETHLNAREFKYYSYYNRIRKQLSQYWEPKVREKMMKMFRTGRAPASTGQDRITKLMIVLNNQGRLMKVQLLSDSGVSDLDDAAIEAFRAAAPFPNPPKGIVEDDGTVKIRWDFILET